MHEPKYPNRNEIEVPLLQALLELGGKIKFSVRGKQIEEMLAEWLHLTNEQRDFTAPNYNSEGHRKWRNEIQFVRNKLADKGHLDREHDDIWEISVQGYHRLNAQPHAGAPVANPSVKEEKRARRKAILDSL